jgi:uncharacterized membrane protein HdeD (DUF308 family)
VKVVTILVGLVFLAGGIALWIGPLHQETWTVVWGGIVVGLLLVGLGALMIGISEIRSASEERRMAQELAASTPPPQQQTPGGGSSQPPS